MKSKITIVLISGILLSMYSCNKSIKSVMVPTAPIPVEITPIILPDTVYEVSKSDTISNILEAFPSWTIEKKSIGPISIGMDIKTTDSILSAFKKQNALAEDFGFSGGSPAYIYSFENEPVIAIVQTLYHKKVYAIIAMSDQLKSENGIHPKITVEDLLKIYPKMKFSLDPMNGWESAEDPINQWDFIFNTNSKNRIGTYLNPDLPSIPKRFTAKSIWIAVR